MILRAAGTSVTNAYRDPTGPSRSGIGILSLSRWNGTVDSHSSITTDNALRQRTPTSTELTLPPVSWSST